METTEATRDRGLTRKRPLLGWVGRTSEKWLRGMRRLRRRVDDVAAG